MRKFTSVVMALLLTLCLAPISGLAGTATKSGGNSYVPGQILVKFKRVEGKSISNQVQGILANKGVSKVQALYPANQKTDLRAYLAVGLDRVVSGWVPVTADVEALARELEADPTVEYASPNYIVKADSVVPNDPLYGSEQHLPQVRAAMAWGIATGDSSVVIAILDTGVDWDHPDLAANMWKNPDEIPGNGVDDDGNFLIDDTMGWDFVQGVSNVYPGEDSTIQDNNPMDFNGHGTHVAGIASAVTNNSTGVASLAWGCRIMALRIGYHAADGNGYGTYEAMGQAFVYAADQGASVANLSFGTGEPILDAARYAYMRGVVVCNSAGNSATDFASILGAQPYALSVAAVAADDKKASYSSYNSLVDISAPGGDFSGAGGGFLSTFVNPSGFFGGDLYGRFQGTSMASPYVASLAALLKSQHPAWTPADIMFQILATADSIDGVNPLYRGKLGAGRINAYRAVVETPPPASPKIAFTSMLITDQGSGNNDGRVDPGETGKIILNLENTWGDLTNGVITFEAFSPAANVTSGTWNIGTFRGLRDIDANTASNAAAPFTVSIHPSAVPMVIPCRITITGDNGFQLIRTLDLSVSPSVLFVDDHGGGGDASDVAIEPYFSEALRASNTAYAYWDHGTQGTPSYAVLSKYSLVVWGCEWAFPSLDASDRTAIATYLENGGRLFISGQDIAWDLNATPTSGDNEFTRSGGTTQSWFMSYLSAEYVADDANGSEATTRITGVSGDPIGDGLALDVSQPGRTAANQYPDVIYPYSNALSIFDYGDNTSAGVRTELYGRVVYFSFGGLESISSDSLRNVVFDRVVSWLYQRTLTISRLPDTEDSTSAVTVDASVSTIDSILSVDLYWDSDGAFPFNVVPMSSTGGGHFTAQIPAQNMSTEVQYFVRVNTSAGVIPITFRSFRVGIDNIPPDVTILSAPSNTLRRSGPFAITISAKDNIGVDSASVYVYYALDGGEADSLLLTPTGSENVFSGNYMLSTPGHSGSTVDYYVVVHDRSQARNSGRSPLTGTAQFLIGRQLVDDFESVRPVWDFGSGWGRVTNRKRSGQYSITDSPGTGVNSPPDENSALLWRDTLDLTGYSRAFLYYGRYHNLFGRDTLYIESSLDGSSWGVLNFHRGNQASWVLDSIPLQTGAGTGQTMIRFRVRTAASRPGVYDGAYLDDIEIRTDAFISSVPDERTAGIPRAFTLYQNYPNPFNPSTTVRFDLPSASIVTLKVYNLLGQEVAIILDRTTLAAGTHDEVFNASGLASGVYILRLTDGRSSTAVRMVLMK